MKKSVEPIIEALPQIESRPAYRGYIILGGVIVVCIIAASFFFIKYRKAQEALNVQKSSGNQVTMLIQAVGKLIELPTGEDPTIATVSDKNKLKNQPFFAKAENGDKVLIYPKFKKAILYRPSSNKIIEVAPVNLQPTPSAQNPTISVTNTVEKNITV